MQVFVAGGSGPVGRRMIPQLPVSDGFDAAAGTAAVSTASPDAIINQLNIMDNEPGSAVEWTPVYAPALGGPPPWRVAQR
jgi:hypothetical protein